MFNWYKCAQYDYDDYDYPGTHATEELESLLDDPNNPIGSPEFKIKLETILQDVIISDNAKIIVDFLDEARGLSDDNILKLILALIKLGDQVSHFDWQHIIQEYFVYYIDDADFRGKVVQAALNAPTDRAAYEILLAFPYLTPSYQRDLTKKVISDGSIINLINLYHAIPVDSSFDHSLVEKIVMRSEDSNILTYFAQNASQGNIKNAVAERLMALNVEPIILSIFARKVPMLASDILNKIAHYISDRSPEYAVYFAKRFFSFLNEESKKYLIDKIIDSQSIKWILNLREELKNFLTDEQNMLLSEAYHRFKDG